MDGLTERPQPQRYFEKLIKYSSRDESPYICAAPTLRRDYRRDQRALNRIDGYRRLAYAVERRAELTKRSAAA